MFRRIELKPVYNSYSDDLTEDFYNPILSASIEYKRVSAYFSAKALARFSVGLENLHSNNGKFYLIINKQVEEADYIEMKKGIGLRDLVKKEMLSSLNQPLDMSEIKGLSNLAFLIATERMDIKIAFTSNGIFHDKFGFFTDISGDKIYFRGSNNETEAAIDLNYEAFDISCSWMASPFEMQKIDLNYEEFNSLWENQVNDVYVACLDEVIKKELIKFNKGKIIFDDYDLMKNIIVLDINQDSKMFMKNMLNDFQSLTNSSYYIIDIKHSITKIEGDIFWINEDYSYVEYRRLIEKFEKLSKKLSVKLVVSKKLSNYISEMDLKIEKRRNIGINIKNKSSIIRNQFDKYKIEIDELMLRKLRDKQTWDSFFMYSMRKSFNFSVPGSGKTASVLGMFAYLKKNEGVKRIVMVGPKSSFDSWRNEYAFCFGNSSLSVFDWQEYIGLPLHKRINMLTTETGNKSLVLLNYDALPSIATHANDVINDKVLLVFDEVHKIKRINGFLANGALKFARNAKYIVALTGTPIPNSYSDLYNMLKIIFRQEYKHYFGFSPMNMINPTDKAKSEINDKLFPFFCRTTKDELSVPKANENSLIDVPSTEDENEIYRILISKYRNKKLALFIRLLQLESNPSMLLEKLNLEDFRFVLEDTEDSDIAGIDFTDYSDDLQKRIKRIEITSKKLTCINLIRNLISQGKSVILWCVFIDSIKSFESEFEKLGISVGVIFGATSQERRSEILDKFNDRRIQVLITNPHTLAESVSLHHSCHDAVYFELTFNLVHLLQSKDRIHRLGLPSGQYTQYHFLMNRFSRNNNEESVDERVYLRLLEKEQIMMDAIEANILEDVSTSQEDIDEIFKFLK